MPIPDTGALALGQPDRGTVVDQAQVHQVIADPPGRRQVLVSADATGIRRNSVSPSIDAMADSRTWPFLSTCRFSRPVERVKLWAAHRDLPAGGHGVAKVAITEGERSARR